MCLVVFFFIFDRRSLSSNVRIFPRGNIYWNTGLNRNKTSPYNSKVRLQKKKDREYSFYYLISRDRAFYYNGPEWSVNSNGWPFLLRP